MPATISRRTLEGVETSFHYNEEYGSSDILPEPGSSPAKESAPHSGGRIPGNRASLMRHRLRILLVSLPYHLIQNLSKISRACVITSIHLGAGIRWMIGAILFGRRQDPMV